MLGQHNCNYRCDQTFSTVTNLNNQKRRLNIWLVMKWSSLLHLIIFQSAAFHCFNCCNRPKKQNAVHSSARVTLVSKLQSRAFWQSSPLCSWAEEAFPSHIFKLRCTTVNSSHVFNGLLQYILGLGGGPYTLEGASVPLQIMWFSELHCPPLN